MFGEEFDAEELQDDETIASSSMCVSAADACDDKDGFHVFRAGELIAGRYLVCSSYCTVDPPSPLPPLLDNRAHTTRVCTAVLWVGVQPGWKRGLQHCCAGARPAARCVECPATGGGGEGDSAQRNDVQFEHARREGLCGGEYIVICWPSPVGCTLAMQMSSAYCVPTKCPLLIVYKLNVLCLLWTN